MRGGVGRIWFIRGLGIRGMGLGERRECYAEVSLERDRSDWRGNVQRMYGVPSGSLNV